MQQFPSGYQAQMPQQSAPQIQQAAQEVRFYKSGLFGFSSAAGRFERDQHKMAGAGWRVKDVAFCGTNLWLQRIISVVYER